MLGHFSCMEMVTYPELIDICRLQDREAVEMMRAEGNELARAYRLHIAKWNADNLLDWSQYRHASLLLIKRMRAHFERSHSVIHPLLDHRGLRGSQSS